MWPRLSECFPKSCGHPCVQCVRILVLFGTVVKLAQIQKSVLMRHDPVNSCVLLVLTAETVCQIKEKASLDQHGSAVCSCRSDRQSLGRRLTLLSTIPVSWSPPPQMYQFGVEGRLSLEQSCAYRAPRGSGSVCLEARVLG